ncbi:Pol polyprotein [Cucumis melo var. makuwa]|uniref:Pol polyprotein n=1 Tax=Cucumis melo var. makuwa TaxID=1194695 RepID=A0A5D3C0M6_CUCMM|nr:Pol polyprotein [Cucumis melo var. makuwa]
MYDTSDVVVWAMLGQKKDKVIHLIYYASKTLNEAEENYMTVEKELLVVVFVVEKYKSYIVGYEVTMHYDHSIAKVPRTKWQITYRVWATRLFNERRRKSQNPSLMSSYSTLKRRSPEDKEYWLYLHFVGCGLFSKWVEAISYVKNNAMTVSKYLKKNIFLRFGTPRAIIIDEGSHFAKLLSKYNINHKVATAHHLQTNGQAEVSNRKMKNILEKVVNLSCKNWAYHLDLVCYEHITSGEERLLQLNDLQEYYSLTHVYVCFHESFVRDGLDRLWSERFSIMVLWRSHRWMEVACLRLMGNDSRRIMKTKIASKSPWT